MKHVFAWLKTLACVALIVGLLAASMPAMAVSGSTTLAVSGAQYIVIASGLNVRAGAGIGYAVISTARRGSQLTYLSTTNGWWRVRLANGTTGYVDKQYLTPVSADRTGAYTVTANVLRVRATPNTSAKRVGKLNRGTSVYVSRLNGDWGYITSGGVSGWVALKYLSQSGGSAKPAASISVGSIYTVIATKLNVRRSASTNATRLDTISAGTSVRVARVSGSWAYVSYAKNGSLREGWVSTAYLG